ncbi:hypothetical protein [Imhoffiella purpurea]|uniref:Uncharacterized protein n=1 Tax=Imhoffiella purpurea TaxID=1249627 RepID=W9VM84_9GAMM|nr:hypothetical protein [Imhoffiella purpurea]EXJ17212.1 hypothetical protein D779_0039 [Imhoffiella purpurea]
MSFDALTILGISSSILCGGFLVALVNRNGAGARAARRLADSKDKRTAESRP